MIWRLPESLEIRGSIFAIRTDYRDILKIFEAYNDPDLDDDARVLILLNIMYPDFDNMPPELYQEAAEKAMEFINHGQNDDVSRKPQLMDWEQDADIIVPAINKVAGTEVRALPHLHWWTFVGYYMEIGDSLFSQVVNIRYKKAHGQKLEKWEKEFEKDNRHLIAIKKKLSEEEQEERSAERAALRDLTGI